jgi:hypothetical protein
MTIYLAGPMRGIPLFNFPAFDEAAKRGRAMGHTIISPADLDRAAGFDPASLPPGHDWTTGGPTFNLDACIRRDVDGVLASNAIAVLPGWERSSGCAAEMAIARWRSMPILDARTFTLLDPNILREAERLTRGDRNDDYGHPKVEHDRIAAYWSIFVGVPIRAEQVAMMMVLLKVARLGHRYKRDSLVDIAGYADCAQRIIEAETRPAGK